MSNQKSSGDDASHEHPEERNHIHDVFEGIWQILDELMREEPELCAFAEQQGSNVDCLPERGVEQQVDNADSSPEVDDEYQDRNLDRLPAEDHTTITGLKPDPWQLEDEALRKRVQAVIVYFLRSMNNTEVSEMLKKGMMGGIAPNPNTPLETKVPHLERMKKRRRSGMNIIQRTVMRHDTQSHIRFLLYQDTIQEACKRWKGDGGKGGSGGGAPIGR
jgi:hypothetical protein